jgi:uncharacterized protein YyaL (SSP411 family)
MQVHRIFLLLLLLVPQAVADQAPEKTNGIAWQPWSDGVFAQAKHENKFVLLDLQAVWCHWCHVMDEKTYSDPQVIALIRSKFIPVRVDQDSRPDLANRYEDYGWPATVVFNGAGGEIVKRRGYLPPDEMASMLKAIIADPTPGPSVTGVKTPDLAIGSSIHVARIAQLRRQLDAGYDQQLGAWGTDMKFMDWDNTEYCLTRAQAGDKAAAAMAKQTLSQQMKLIDPVWGGVDQYSAEGDWNHPHYEKIMQMQAENIRIYAEAAALWHDPADLKAATSIYGYVRNFLTSPDGVVYVSQDADLVPGQHSADYYALDDAARRKLGVPKIDTHIYARENGWFIVTLAQLYATTGDVKYRDEAARAATWILAHRSVPGGGFSHGGETDGVLYLGDTLAMGRALLALYTITGDAAWRDHAEAAASFIRDRFAYETAGKAVGFATAANEPAGNKLAPTPEFDENVALARWTNLLSHVTGNERDHEMAQAALRFISIPEIDRNRRAFVGGLLLAQQECSADPLHIAVVGHRDDDKARKLFAVALAFPSTYKQIDWVDGSASASDIAYPVLPSAAAYVCANRACSAPVFTTPQLTALLQRRASAPAE